MKILLIVGQFPVLSETFIIRKAIGLAEKGHAVLVMSRKRGDLRVAKSFPGYSKIKVQYLIPAEGPFSARTVWVILVHVIKFVFLRPVNTLKIFKLCRVGAGGVWNRRFVRSFLSFLPFVNKGDYQILHAEFLNVGVHYYPLAKELDFKLGVSCRGADLHLLPLRSAAQMKAAVTAVEYASLIHCVSGEMAGWVNKMFGITKTVVVNRPAIDLNAILNHSRMDSDLPVTILAVGRLEWKKGFDYLLKSYSILKERGHRFKAVIVGTGSLYHELRFSIGDLNIQDCVVLMGAVYSTEVHRLMSQASVFVLSSVEEGISNAVLEAMAHEMAVVSTRCGGMEEVIENDVDGLLVPIRDPVSMADAIERLLVSPERRRNIGQKARRKIEMDFTIERQARVFEEAYKEILQ